MTLPLETPSLLLRRFCAADAPRVFALSQEEGMRAWLPDQVYEDEEAARRVLTFLIAQYEGPEAPRAAPLVLAVCRRDSAELIGHVGLSPHQGGVEIGYALAEVEQGRGLATQAVRAMVAWAREAFALSDVLALAASDNVPSWRVLEKAGFTLRQEGMQTLHGVRRLVRTYAVHAAC